MRRILAIITIIAATAAVGLATQSPALACVADPTTGQCTTPPPSYPGNVTYSRYVTTTDMYTMGCNQGHTSDSEGQPRQVVVLSFGDPGWQTYGTWGAWDGAIGGFVTNATVEANVKRYMQGFWNCTVAGSRSFMIVAPGVTNHGSGINSSAANALGTAWGNMVQDLNSWISSSGMTSQLQAYGSIDAEPGWGVASNALAWAAGFSTSGNFYFDFGSADGCPPSGSCNNGWTQANEYQMAWGNAKAFAIPEIYNNTMAQQWAQISAWGKANTSSGPIRWTAAMSQYQACLDQGAACSGTDDTPQQSWQALYSASGVAPIYATEVSYQSS